MRLKLFAVAVAALIANTAAANERASERIRPNKITTIVKLPPRSTVKQKQRKQHKQRKRPAQRPVSAQHQRRLAIRHAQRIVNGNAGHKAALRALDALKESYRVERIEQRGVSRFGVTRKLRRMIAATKCAPTADSIALIVSQSGEVRFARVGNQSRGCLAKELLAARFRPAAGSTVITARLLAYSRR